MKFPILLNVIGLFGLTSLAAHTLNIVAHPDDDLLFQNPDILHDINNDITVRTVFITSGDAGQDPNYWTQRQAGAMAAYAQMAGVSSTWDESDIGVHGKDIPLYTLREASKVSVAFMHIPDGSIDGNGFARTGYQTLEKLWKNNISPIKTIDDSATTYTRQELIDTLTKIINDFKPTKINSLDYLHDFGTGDHSDHTATGLFTNTATISSSFPGSVVAYRGYPIKNDPVNVGGNDLARKKAAFYTYAGYDASVCASDQACVNTEYELWLPRLYTAN
ncbi:hypothetical protein ARAM_001177 [Aspergillus rambellii]|uniref:N-acetylglucosaminylphosphatidylinositol deacetylase n=1 Tax=Aspergillus rambellii TaxID=308745 RepID=A0A0F8WND2_9EURO|nr:hypothetical protein ARAM_001177 [Aspergillus rambellii]